jgi:predicted AlkP superfamily phosphohydrolase/phosphomutase
MYAETPKKKKRFSRLVTSIGVPFLASVLITLGFVAIDGCGGDSREAPAVEQIQNDNWESFLESRGNVATGAGPVVVVGIDGAAWHWIDRLIQMGAMPNLARIKKEGAWASLTSTRTYVTPPAWTSMFTGYVPEKTGVYSFGTWVRETRQFLTANADDVRVPFVWEAASRAGLKTGVFNVPMTYPVYPVNGALVSGMMTPLEAKSPPGVVAVADRNILKECKSAPGVVNHSLPLRAALGDSLNLFLFTIHDTTDDKIRNYDHISLRVLPRHGDGRESAGNATDVFEFATGIYSQWLPFLHSNEGELTRVWCKIKLSMMENEEFNIDFSQTVFPIDATYTYPEDLHNTLSERFGFYLPTQFLSKEVVLSLTRDMVSYSSFFYDYDDWDLYTFVFTQSDNIHHVAGFDQLAAHVYHEIDRALGEIMDKMPPGGTLIVVSDHGNGEFEYGVDLNKVFERLKLLKWKTTSEIDHDETLVFHNLWHLYFNREKITREELKERGYSLPASVDPYEFLVEFVIEAGKQIRRPNDTRIFPVNFHRMTERRTEDDPDMWVEGASGNYVCDYWNVMKPHDKMLRRLEGTDRFWHIREGIVLAWGEGVRKGFDAGTTEIENVGPTILYLLGLPVAPDMDGRVIQQLFKPQLLRDRPLYVNAGYRDIPRSTFSDDVDRESLKKKLESLGYIQ